MKIKLNANYKDHDKLVKRLAEELPELTIRSKERTWGEDKPSFKYRKKLYEFNNIEEFINQAKKILKLTDKDYGKKTRLKVKDIDPRESAESGEVEELLLEIPVEKYNLSDLNIKLRLGSHSERSSSYESNEQTLHYEIEETDEAAGAELDAEDVVLDKDEISMTSINNDIILNIPSEKFSLNDLNLNIKFTQYGEANSTYEVKKLEKEVRKAEDKSRDTKEKTVKNEASEKAEDKTEEPKKAEAEKKETAPGKPAPKKAAAPRKSSGTKRAPAKKPSGTSEDKNPDGTKDNDNKQNK